MQRQRWRCGNMPSVPVLQILGSSCELLEGLARVRPVNRLCPHLAPVPSTRNFQSTPTHASKPLHQCAFLQDSFVLPSPKASHLLQHSSYSMVPGGVCVQPVSSGWKLWRARLRLRIWGDLARTGQRARGCLGHSAPLFPSRGSLICH